ncbi:MAG: DUF1919 domain-containing protein [Prevotella sp.]
MNFLKQRLYHYFDVFYNKYYPLSILNRLNNRKRNNQKELSILCGNCIGGYMYYQLGVRFDSPTVNLVITNMYKYIMNLNHYCNCKLENTGEFVDGGIPVARLDDIRIVLTHYKTFEEGKKYWEKRVPRIHKDNMYVIEFDISLDEEKIKNYGSLKCRKLIIFTSKKYDYPYCFQVKEFSGLDHVGNILGKTLLGKWKFEKYFDWVGWLNSVDPIAEHFRKD